MRNRIFLLLFVLAGLHVLLAEQEEAARPLSIYVLRTGEQLQGPHITTYRLFEYAQQRGRWIVPDVGYYDVGRPSTQYWFAGAGAELHHSDRLVWTQMLYAAQMAGSATHNERAFWIWPVLDSRYTPRLTSEVVVYPTIPLDRAERWGVDLDRAKLEYALRPKLLLGAGYNGSICAGNPWTSRPFLTATRSSRAGSWEFWLQRMPHGAQIQVRYQLVRHGF
jgi:hypothetical protein